MPFKSQAQRRFMYSQHPAIAKEFEAATPAGAKLPARVSKKKPSGAARQSHIERKVKTGLKAAFPDRSY